jgi:sec-independent protein translocase protein TatB
VFDIGWTELLVIACVTVLVVGPKELPGLLRTLGKTVGNLRKMAGDFQKQFDEAIREAELDEVRKKMNQPFQPLEDARKAALDFQKTVSDTVRIPENPTATPAATPAAPPAGQIAASLPEPALATQLATPPAELQAQPQKAPAAVSTGAAAASVTPGKADAAPAGSSVKPTAKRSASAKTSATTKPAARTKSATGTGKAAAAEKVPASAGAGTASRTGKKS